MGDSVYPLSRRARAFPTPFPLPLPATRGGRRLEVLDVEPGDTKDALTAVERRHNSHRNELGGASEDERGRGEGEEGRKVDKERGHLTPRPPTTATA